MRKVRIVQAAIVILGLCAIPIHIVLALTLLMIAVIIEVNIDD